MTIKTSKPTTPARRQYKTVDYSLLTKTKPEKSLLKPLKKKAGRNSFGRITVRHQGGGNKRRYRVIEFGEKFINQQGKVETLEYDPNRNAFIMKVLFENGSRAYFLAPEGIKLNDKIMIANQTPVEIGNRMMLKNIPIGTQVYNIETLPNQGGKLVRSAGLSAIVMGNEEKYTLIKMPSKEIRKILSSCFATIGQVSNSEYRLINVGKAGKMRHRGIRPTVRGSVMNPRDHPYGGGEGRTTRGTRKPKDKWGNVTGGRKTRNKKKWSKKLIVKDRRK